MRSVSAGVSVAVASSCHLRIRRRRVSEVFEDRGSGTSRLHARPGAGPLLLGGPGGFA
jgi:hypothetical protein